MSFFYVENWSFKTNHLLPTSVGTIMKNNHIIVGFGRLVAPFNRQVSLPFSATSRLQRLERFSLVESRVTSRSGTCYYQISGRKGGTLSNIITPLQTSRRSIFRLSLRELLLGINILLPLCILFGHGSTRLFYKVTKVFF